MADTVTDHEFHYGIQRQDASGAWSHPTNYGLDLDHAMRNARWFRSLACGRVSCRVVVVCGDNVSVLLAEGCHG